jgi:hypothetical protein
MDRETWREPDLAARWRRSESDARKVGTLSGLVSVLLMPGQAAVTRRRANAIGLPLPMVAEVLATQGADGLLTQYLMGWGEITIDEAFEALEASRAQSAVRLLTAVNQ